MIKNGISVNSFTKFSHKSTFFLRKQIHLEEDCFLFGYLGRFMPEKGFTILIDASLSDRIAVMFKGIIIATIDAVDADRKTIGLWMAGVDSELRIGQSTERRAHRA